MDTKELEQRGQRLLGSTPASTLAEPETPESNGARANELGLEFSEGVESCAALSMRGVQQDECPQKFQWAIS